MITTVILDVDGTLVDSNYLHAEAFARALLHVGRPIPRTDLHRQIGKGAEKFLPDMLGGDEALMEQVQQHHTRLYVDDLRHYAYPLPGARELIASLAERGYALWVGTSAKPEELNPLLEQLEARERLRGVVCADDVEEPKPEPDIFGVALRRSGAAADETLVVGDTPWDVEAAAKVGLRTVCVLTGGAWSAAELTEAGAVAVFRDCAALLVSGFPEGF